MNAASLYEAGRYRSVERNPFARSSLLRFSAKALEMEGACRWCGQAGRWCYADLGDASSPSGMRPVGPFCGRDCLTASEAR